MGYRKVGYLEQCWYSVKQLARWLEQETGEEVVNLRKETVSQLLGRETNSDTVNRIR